MNAQINIDELNYFVNQYEYESTFILREGCLNDDTLHIAPNGYHYRGGYIAVIQYYTFQNHWSDNKHVVRFKSVNSLSKYLVKHYPDFEF